MRCFNCGAELDMPYTFCDICDMPQPEDGVLQEEGPLLEGDSPPPPDEDDLPLFMHNQGDPIITSPDEPHLACIVLIDTSDLIAGYTIGNLNKALQRLIAKVRMDEMASRRVDIAVVGFDSSAYVIADFMPVAEISEPYSFSAGGGTAMGAGIDLAIDMLYDRCEVYDSLGTPAYRPWILMVSNSTPSDDVDYAAERVRYAESSPGTGSLRFFALGAGYYDKASLLKITNRVMELTDADFERFFSWVGEGLIEVSASPVGDEPKLGDLPANARVVAS